MLVKRWDISESRYITKISINAGTMMLQIILALIENPLAIDPHSILFLGGSYEIVEPGQSA